MRRQNRPLEPQNIQINAPRAVAAVILRSYPWADLGNHFGEDRCSLDGGVGEIEAKVVGQKLTGNGLWDIR